MSRLFAEVLDRVYEGWLDGSRRYGLARGSGRWAHVNGYLYYGERGEGYAGDPELAAQAEREHRWVEEYERWFEVERPAVVAENLRLQRVEPRSLADDELAAHVRTALEHLLAVAPLHFSHRGREASRRVLRRRADAEGVPYEALEPRFAGGSPASRRPAELVAAIAGALRDGGIDPASVASLDDVRREPAAALLLDGYLEELGHRLLDSYDLACPTLHERPEVIVASIRAAGHGGATRVAWEPSDLPPMSDELRRLFEEARTSAGTEDDDDGVCLFWPSGLLRRALLEVARRRPSLASVTAIFEVGIDELDALLDGADPTDAELTARWARRQAAAGLVPPPVLGPGTETGAEPPPAGGALVGVGVGGGVVRGRACVVRGPDSEGLGDVEPGDVLVAVTTTPGYNAVLPIVAAVVTETHMGHTIIGARELGIPAIVGVAGLLDAVAHGAIVEVDAAAGTVRVIG